MTTKYKTASKWPTVSLGEIFDISSSKRILESQWQISGVPFYRAREIVRLAKDRLVQNELFITEELYSEYKKKYGVPKAGDLMISAVGTLGACYVVKQSDRFYFKDASVLRFSPKLEVCSKFIKHAFNTNYILDQVHSGSGSTVGTYTISRANETKILLPPLSEQRRIAEILDRAEALRAKRRAALAELDSLTQALFLDMFGELRKNEFRWPLLPFEQIVNETKLGLVRCAQEFGPDFSVPYVRMNAITRSGELDLTTIQSTEVSQAEINSYRLEPGDFLFNTRNSEELVGKTALFRTTGMYVFNNNIMRIRFTTEAHPEFVAAAFRTAFIQHELNLRKSGTTNVFAIYYKDLRTLPVPLPPIALQQEFARRVTAVEKLKASHRAALADLDSLFAALQHRAFRGEL